MSIEETLRRTDRRRRQAMIEADGEALGALLADDLIWTHSSGKTDGKRSFIEKIRSKAVLYLALDVEDDVVSSHGDVMLHHGTLTGRVSADAGERTLANRFLAVWKRAGDGFELIAWQSTGL